MRPIPVDRLLVPAAPEPPPPDATVVEVALAAGLPAAVPLDAVTTLMLTLPTGLAVEWRALDAAAPVADARAEHAPRLPAPPDGPPARPVGDPARARLTLTVQRNGRPVAVLPVAVGRYRIVEPGAPGAPAARRYDVWLLDWDVRAGTVRGPAAVGSRLRLAWRVADQGTPAFAPRPVAPAVVVRTPPPLPERTDPVTGGRLGPADLVRLKRGRLLR